MMSGGGRTESEVVDNDGDEDRLTLRIIGAVKALVTAITVTVSRSPGIQLRHKIIVNEILLSPKDSLQAFPLSEDLCMDEGKVY
jgi:hypothetical protein